LHQGVGLTGLAAIFLDLDEGSAAVALMPVVLAVLGGPAAPVAEDAVDRFAGALVESVLGFD